MMKCWCLCVILFLTMMGKQAVMAQEIEIRGLVVDEKNLPLPGATIRVKNTAYGAVTDENGRFRLKDRWTGEKLLISYVGKKTVEIPVSKIMRVVLYPDERELEQVVVQVAYGSQKRYEVTGSVAAIQSKDISLRPVTSVTSALEGMVTGVQVNNTYGQPGDAPEIRIRGFGSVNGVNAPLYVVDGVPFAGSLSELNPEDVESVSVLKDGAAAALYGNRAANGVVLIAMKRPDSRRLNMEFSVRQGIYARGIKEYKCVGTDDYMEVMWKSYRNSLMTSNSADYPTRKEANAAASATLISSFLKYNIYNVAEDRLFDAEGHLVKEAEIHDAVKEDLDWFDPLVRKGWRQEYNLQGGALQEKSDYRFSLGYLNEKGFLTNAGFDRLTARLQLNLNPKQWLKTGMTLSGNHQNQDITDGTGNTYVNVFNVARYMAPVYPVHLHDLTTGDYILDEQGQKQYDTQNPQYNGRNIIRENELNKNKLTKTGLTGQAYAKVILPAGFDLMVRGDLYLSNQETKRYLTPEIGDGMGVGKNYQYHYRFKRYVFQEQLRWKQQISRHQLEVLLAHENFYYNYQYTTFAKSDQILPGNASLSNFATLQGLLGYPKDYRTESYLGTIRYQYGNKYFAEVAYRRDGSSRFHPDHRWGNFGSLGVSWVASKERFIKDIGWVDYLKMRLSYGEVGNDASVGYYGWMSLYRIVTNGGEAALYKSQNAAEDIKWETSVSCDAAIEATLFHRWNFSIGYFDKRSRDLLFNVSLPLSAGATSTDAGELATVLRNIGSVSNRGWELATDIDLIRSSGWRWNVGANATILKNKILTLPAENRETGILPAGQNQKYMEGHSIYEWWLPLFAGVDCLTGNSLYVADLENYYVGEKEEGKQLLPENERVKIGEDYYTTNTSYARKDWCGSALPKVYGSFSSRLEWKGFSLSALFTYSLGGKIYDQSYASLMATGTTPRAVHRDILKSWEQAPEGMVENSPDRLDVDGIPAVNSVLSVKNNAVSSRFLIDGSYLWVKNISASYSFPQHWVHKLDLEGISISWSMENVALFTKRQGMNPQQSFIGLSEDVLVAPRVLSLGVTVKF